jgi:hypothetical protein
MSSSNFEECIDFVTKHIPRGSCNVSPAQTLVFYIGGKISTTNCSDINITIKSLFNEMIGDAASGSYTTVYVSKPFANSLEQLNCQLDFTSSDNITVGEMNLEHCDIIHVSPFPPVITTTV